MGLPKYPYEPEFYSDISTAEDGTRWGIIAGVAKWFTVGEITERDAPPRKWMRLIFDISRVDRKGVVRPFDLVILRPSYSKGGEVEVLHRPSGILFQR